MEVIVNSSKLFYQKKGTGKKCLLLFHGFGQDHTIFSSLIDLASDQYTCYSFDLFFHHQSEWTHDEQSLEKTEWKKFMHAFFVQEGVEKFCLLGFSMGARFVLATLEMFPEKTEQIFLIAPDGIKNNFWYTTATYLLPFRKLFKSMIRHPNRFFGATRIAHKLKVIDSRLLRFAEHQMNTEEKRKKVYFSWVVFRKLKFKLRKIALLINKHQIKTIVIVGEHDNVISPKVSHYFKRHVKNCSIEIVDASHNRLIHESRRFL